MRYTIATVAALASVVAAGDAPVVENNPLGVTFSATIPQLNAVDTSGAMKIASSPDGEGVNIQFSLYNLPGTGMLNYGLYTGNVVDTNDCSTAGAIFNPNNGFTGEKCGSDKAGCAAGALSDKYGQIEIAGGGSGTGYFAANYADKFLSMVEGDAAFFGGGSVAVTDETGAFVACANFVDSMDAAKGSKEAKHQATQTTASSGPSSSASAAAGSGSDGSSGDSSDSGAGRAAVPILAAAFIGLGAFML